MTSSTLYLTYSLKFVLSMSENSVIQQGHTLVFRPDRSSEVGLSNDLIF